MPVSTAAKVSALSEDFHSQRRLAELLGVSPAQVTRWRRGLGIDELNARRRAPEKHPQSHHEKIQPPHDSNSWQSLVSSP